MYGSQFSFHKAKEFVELPANAANTIEGIVRIGGGKLSVSIRGDGNCFHSATTMGALLGACCQGGRGMLQLVVARLEAAVERVKGGTSWGKLPSPLQVTYKCTWLL